MLVKRIEKIQDAINFCVQFPYIANEEVNGRKAFSFREGNKVYTMVRCSTWVYQIIVKSVKGAVYEGYDEYSGEDFVWRHRKAINKALEKMAIEKEVSKRCHGSSM
jgi:hypothetical protein